MSCGGVFILPMLIPPPRIAVAIAFAIQCICVCVSVCTHSQVEVANLPHIYARKIKEAVAQVQEHLKAGGTMATFVPKDNLHRYRVWCGARCDVT